MVRLNTVTFARVLQLHFNACKFIPTRWIILEVCSPHSAINGEATGIDTHQPFECEVWYAAHLVKEFSGAAETISKFSHTTRVWTRIVQPSVISIVLDTCCYLMS